jgi:predicted SnoaL-like aldol condensation-catalyzing enzyme
MSAEGDRALRRPDLHRAQPARRRRQAFVDCFERMVSEHRGRRVVEHWGVLQVVPARSADDNTMF